MAPTLSHLDTTTKSLLRDLSAQQLKSLPISPPLEVSFEADIKLKPLQAHPQSTTDDHHKVIVVVDPYSTGMALGNGLMQNGHHCICVLSDRLENLLHLLSEESTKQYDAVITHEGNLNHTIEKVHSEAARLVKGSTNKNSTIHHVIAGGELGVRLADQLTHAFGLDGNLMEHSIARRDKYLMGEALRKAGVRAVKQFKTSSWEDVQTFVEQEAGKCVVLKPVDSAGSDNVVLCSTIQEAKQAFQRIIGKTNVLGITNTSVLIQEFLEGDEYVVDSVSHNGIHKVTTIWKYDKRRVNDAAFVYFGLELVAADNPLVHGLIDYHIQVLDTLGIRNSPAHAEIKYSGNAPVLVEIGARCHGSKGSWIPITNRCIGYNQVEVTIDTILRPERFHRLPSRPIGLAEHGFEAVLVSYNKGKLVSLPGLEEIERMESFMSQKMFVNPGDQLEITIDLGTSPGSIILAHPNRQVLERDIERIRELEKTGLYLTM